MTLTTLKALKRLPWKIMTVMAATIGVVLMVSDSCDNKLYCHASAVIFPAFSTFTFLF